MIAVISAAWCSSPAVNCLPVSDRLYWSFSSKKMFSSPLNMDMCVCIPDPLRSLKGCGMKVAYPPLMAASSFTTTRYVTTESAIVSALVCRKFISCCPCATS